jgi:hypothetical protein
MAGPSGGGAGAAISSAGGGGWRRAGVTVGLAAALVALVCVAFILTEGGERKTHHTARTAV